MASIGSASLTITPKFDNLGKSVTNALNGVDATSSGVKIGTSVSNGVAQGTSGLAKSGALVGIFSAATTKAMDLIGNSVGAAVSRLDTLNNYPRVMQALGYSAEESEASIAKMSEHLTGLPTALNDMTSTVQGISAITGDLDQATNAGLALNDMLLASGSSTALTTAAMEQFRQMLAKGAPEMQDWKSLTSAMPGQMSQLAKSMLGPTATANDLYAALGGGGGEATISMQQLMDKMVELDTVGGDGITDFATQAKNATGGIETSMANMQTAVSRGLADVLDSIGTDNIKQVTSDLGKGFESALKLIGDGVSAAIPTVKAFYEFVKDIGPSTIPSIAALAALAAAYKGLQGAASIAQNGIGILNSIKGVASSAGDAFLTLATKAKEGSGAQKGLLSVSEALSGSLGGPLVVAGAVAAATIGACVSSYMDMKKKSDSLKGATEGLSSAISSVSSPVQTVSGAYDSLGGSAQHAAVNVGDAVDAVYKQIDASAKLADTISARSSETVASVGLLETYKQTIDDLNNKYDENGNKVQLSASEQAKLKFAIEQVNEQCGTQYRLTDDVNGIITDQNGVIQTNTDEINKNIEAKQQQIRVEAAGENYKDAYKNQTDSLKALNDAQQSATDYLNQHGGAVENLLPMEASEYGKLSQAVMDAQKNYDGATTAVNDASDAMINASTGADQLANMIQKMSQETPNIAKAMGEAGTNVTDLSTKLIDMGVSSDQMANISSDAFARMLSNSGGDLDSLKGMIELYNTTPVVDKDGNINVEDATLVDAQGEVYTWNGTDFVNKNSEAAVKDQDLMDAQGNVWQWNGTSLDGKLSTATVNGNASDGTGRTELTQTNTSISNINGKNVDVNVDGNYASAATNIWDLGSAIRGLTDKAVSVVTNFFENHNAAGGIRPHAAGGIFPRYHAGGAIATRAMPLDIVGEAGAEAIVPLTNKKYVTPFARTVAEQMGNDEVGIDQLLSELRDLKNNLGRIISSSAPVVVETERDFNRRVRRATNV